MVDSLLDLLRSGSGLQAIVAKQWFGGQPLRNIKKRVRPQLSFRQGGR